MPRIPSLGARHLRAGPQPPMASLDPGRRWDSGRGRVHGLSGNVGAAPSGASGDGGVHPDRALTDIRSNDVLLDAQVQQLSCDHEPLDLARSLADLGELGIAQVALDPVLLDVAVSAVDLDRGIRDAAAD